MAFSIPHRRTATTTRSLQTRPKTVLPTKWTQGAVTTATTTGGEELAAVCAHFT